MTAADRVRSDQIGHRVREAASGVYAPPGVRAAVAREQLRSAPTARRPPGAMLAGAGAVLAAGALALVVWPGGATAPDVSAVARVALAAPVSPPPAARGEQLAGWSVGGVGFPAGSEGWRPAGVRESRVGGRTARTVTYERAGAWVGYTVVDGAALPLPADGRDTSYDGIPVRVIRRGPTTTVVWFRNGRTCVLASRTATPGQMLALVD